MDEIRLGRANEQLVASEESLQNRLKFETLLATLSAHFVNLPADRIDSEIEDAQRRICELLDLDRSSLWQYCEGAPGTLQITHLHQPPGSTIPSDRMNTRDFFPWTEQKFLGGETVIISKMADLPPEASRDREHYRLYGTRAVVVVPLSVGGGPVFGALTFSVMREARSWTDTIVKGFQLIAHVFANALARKRADYELRESERRLSMATTAAGAGLWSMDFDTGQVWATPKTRELFHFAPDAELNAGSFYEVIHSEDREKVKKNCGRGTPIRRIFQ